MDGGSISQKHGTHSALVSPQVSEEIYWVSPHSESPNIDSQLGSFETENSFAISKD